MPGRKKQGFHHLRGWLNFPFDRVACHVYDESMQTVTNSDNTTNTTTDEFDLDFGFEDVIRITARPRRTTAERLTGLYFDGASRTQKYIGNKPHMGMH